MLTKKDHYHQKFLTEAKNVEEMLRPWSMTTFTIRALAAYQCTFIIYTEEQTTRMRSLHLGPLEDYLYYILLLPKNFLYLR